MPGKTTNGGGVSRLRGGQAKATVRSSGNGVAATRRGRAGDGAPADGHSTKRDAIVTELRAMMASGKITRGDRIRQDELAELFGTSITPVREALLLLAAEGVLVGEPHRGVRVADVAPESLRANYIIRRLVEPYAMQRTARRISRRDQDQARALLGEMREAAKRGDRVRLGDLNREFHFFFYDRCGLPELAAEIRSLWLSFPWDILQVVSHRSGKSVAEHTAMLDAMDAGDLDAVRRSTEQHIAESYRALLAHLGRSDADPFDLDVD